MADSVGDTNEVPLNEASVGGSLTDSCEEAVLGGDTESNTVPEKSLEESLDCSVR